MRSIWLNACAVMSTGFRGEAYGRADFRRACAASLRGGTSSPKPTAASAICTPTPPEMETSATRWLAGKTPKAAA